MISLVKATPKDCRFVYDLRNSPWAREASHNSGSFSYAQHCLWFEENYHSIRVILRQKSEIGYLRINDNNVSICIDKPYQNKGIGTRVLRKLKGPLRAEIKINNVGSMLAFGRAGFKPVFSTWEKK